MGSEAEISADATTNNVLAGPESEEHGLTPGPETALTG
jgi:hypothetical protein